MIPLRACTILCLLALISATSLSSMTHQRPDSTYFRTIRYGPFALLNHDGNTVHVFVEIGHVHLDTAEFGAAWSESDYSTTFIDQQGNILSRSVGRCDDGESSTRIHPIQFSVPKVGPLILLMSQTVPNGPPICSDGQLFGLDPFDHLVPFSKNMTGCGGMEASTFRAVSIHVGTNNDTDSEYAKDGDGEAAIETADCMENFTLYYLDPVWSSRTSATTFYQTKYRIQVDTSAAASSRMRYRENETDTLVAIFREPTASDQRPASISLRPASSFKFLDAVNRQGWWLHVIIDGLEGYVSETDFPKLGLSDIY